MATILPPTPVGVPPGHSFWNDWYEKLRTLINSGTITTLWTSLDFTASNITDIASRAHNNLQSIQGGSAGDYYHITSAEVGRIPDTTQYSHLLTTTQYDRATSVLSKSSDPTTSDIGSSQWAIYKNTTSGLVKLWANDGGTMKSVLLA